MLIFLGTILNVNHKFVEQYILSLQNTRLDFPFGKEVSVYKVVSKGEDKMFALIAEGSDPLRLSLKCDPNLSKILRETYESVMEGYHLNKKHWITIVLSGQLLWEEVQGLILHSYNLVCELPGHIPVVEAPKVKRKKAHNALTNF